MNTRNRQPRFALRSLAVLLLPVVGGLLFSLEGVQAKSKLQNLNAPSVWQFSPTPGPAAMPGVPDTFHPRAIPELRNRGPEPAGALAKGQTSPVTRPSQKQTELLEAEGYAFTPDDVGENLGSHRLPLLSPSQVKPLPVSISRPLVQEQKPGAVWINEEEDDRVFVSDFHTDTTLYGNAVTGKRSNSSRDRGFFYEENLRYDLFTTRHGEDSLALTLDTTHSNDKREYREGFVLNQLTLESRTANSQLVLGHAFPEFSAFSMNQQMMGLYGAQNIGKTGLKGFTGYRAMEKEDLKNPRRVNGFRVEHNADSVFMLGLNAVTTKDVHENPGADLDIPTLENQVISLDMEVRPSETLFVKAEAAGSKTEFDLRNPIGEQSDTAYRFEGGFRRENFRLTGGVEEAGSSFFSPLGASPRDERSYFGHFFYEANRYVATRLSNRVSRDNLNSFKRATVVRTQPEYQIIFRPSEYYKDLRIDFTYQPLHEYSDNGSFIDRYRDFTGIELHQKAGAFRYFAGLHSTVDDDRITRANNRDIYKLDGRLTWEYDEFKKVYGLCGLEQLNYRVAGGVDRVSLFGFGGQSQFHDDLFLNLDYTREANDLKGITAGSTHDRANMSLMKEYNNQTRVILELEGSNHSFEQTGNTYSDVAAKLRVLKTF